MQNTASLPADQFDELLDRLPAGLDLDQLARQTKAIQRKRALTSGPDLLRLALARGPGGLSLSEAAAWATLLGLARMSDPAVKKRLDKAVAFLDAVMASLLAEQAPGTAVHWPGRIQHVREKFPCRDCEKITQPPAPFHVIARGWAGPSLLAMILFEKYGQHPPLNRQAERYAREGVPLSLSTLADQVGACCAVLAPLLRRVEAYVFAAERLHGDDTTVPVLAKGKTITGRLWTYVRDDRPFAGPDPPAAMFYYSRDRSGEHPARHLAGHAGILQADAGACPRAAHSADPGGGYNKLYEADRQPGPIIEAPCWAHARRLFFVLADLAANARRKAHGKPASVISPLALEAVRRIDAIFAIEREINGHAAAERLAVRRARIAPLIAELEAWMRAERVRLSRHAESAKAIDYMLKRWPAFTRFLDDGRICLSNNAAERALRGIALGRKSWLFAGSDRGGQRAAAIYSLIITAKLNDVDPQA